MLTYYEIGYALLSSYQTIDTILHSIVISSQLGASIWSQGERNFIFNSYKCCIPTPLLMFLKWPVCLIRNCWPDERIQRPKWHVELEVRTYLNKNKWRWNSVLEKKSANFLSMSTELYPDDSDFGQFESAATCTVWSVLSWACWQVLEWHKKKYSHHTNS